MDWLWLQVACGYLLGRFVVACVAITLEALADHVQAKAHRVMRP